MSHPSEFLNRSFNENGRSRCRSFQLRDRYFTAFLSLNQLNSEIIFSYYELRLFLYLYILTCFEILYPIPLHN